MRSLHDDTFQYLRPTQLQMVEMEEARKAVKVYAEFIDRTLDTSADKTYILRKLREIAMWVNVAITRHPDGSPIE